MSRRTRAAAAIATLLAFFAADEHGHRPHVRPARTPRGRKFWRGSHDGERARRHRQIQRGILKVTP
jgi:hypothetical protein